MYSSPISSQNFPSLRPPLSFYPFSLISSLNSHDYFYQVIFSQIWTFSVGAIVSSAFMYAGVTHELSTFPLRIRDMRLSSITPSTFLQAFAPAVILDVAKAINIVDFALGKCHFLSWLYKLQYGTLHVVKLLVKRQRHIIYGMVGMFNYFSSEWWPDHTGQNVIPFVFRIWIWVFGGRTDHIREAVGVFWLFGSIRMHTERLQKCSK